jgi:hypothetical protein
MEALISNTAATHLEKHLSHLKIISRLLGHELHAQSGPRLTLSREEITEVQTSLDLFIEEMVRVRAPAAIARSEPQPVPARN